ncbi:hypothetical protein K7432_009878 [Basidiobolus ranarum]|uniref:DUF202 domain-containing protein n=1 Tax=Basidiobolus ranarum TaxID=34480 RepID=A0ABR2VWD8_9FUNG
MTTPSIARETDPLLLPRTQSRSWLCESLRLESLLIVNNGSTARDQLGYERTFLAWIRFAIVLVSFGASILYRSEKGFLHLISPFGYELSFLVSVFYFIIGVVTIIMALTSYLRHQYIHSTSRAPIQSGQSMNILFILVAILTVVVTVVVLFYDSASE